jgi:hypothetical protein
MGPIIQVGKNREILTVLLNVLQGLAADVVRAVGLREECRGIKAQVITDGQNPPGPLRGRCGENPRHPTFQQRQGQRQTGALEEAAAVDRM